MNGQPTNARINKSGEVDARNEASAISVLHNLRTLILNLEVCGHQTLDSRRMSKDIRGLRAGSREELIERIGIERAGNRARRNMRTVRSSYLSNDPVELERGSYRAAINEHIVPAIQN